MMQEFVFDTADELNATLSAQIAVSLAQAVAMRGRALFVASGGTSPGGMYQALSQAPLNWPALTVLPSDERWVAHDHPASNELLIRRTLLQGAAGSARYVPLTSAHPTPEEGAASINAVLGTLDWPSDFTLLGMGLDGHVAGIVPAAQECASAMDLAGAVRALALRIPSKKGQPPAPTDWRLTLTMPALMQSRRISLLFFGEEKMTAFRKFVAQKSNAGLPIQTLVQQEHVPVQVFWTRDTGGIGR